MDISGKQRKLHILQQAEDELYQWLIDNINAPVAHWEKKARLLAINSVRIIIVMETW